MNTPPNNPGNGANDAAAIAADEAREKRLAECKAYAMRFLDQRDPDLAGALVAFASEAAKPYADKPHLIELGNAFWAFAAGKMILARVDQGTEELGGSEEAARIVRLGERENMRAWINGFR
jgi:hypothetical protein